MMEFDDLAIVTAGYSDRSFVALYLAQVLELFDGVTDFNEPFFYGNLTDTLANVA